VAGLLPAGKRLDGMFISTEQRTHSVRVAPHPDGALAIVGGEPWKTGHTTKVEEHYEALTQWAREQLGIVDFRYRWSTQDNSAPDRVPLIGRLHVGNDRLHVVAGFGGWGMTSGAVAGELLADLVTEGQSPYEELYDPIRLGTVTGTIAMGARIAKDAVKEMLLASVLPAEVDSVDEIGPGQGAIARIRGSKTAVHRDDAGQLHCVSARCTHLGCYVRFNDAERSWDCPCHGSRFAADGAVLQGPAIAPLDPVEPPS
jgi:nitrite reductase/ring-hydroxylating ferredoxin subunit